MATKQRSRKRPAKGAPASARPGPRRQSRPKAKAKAPPPPTLQQELLLLARSSARSLQGVLVAFAVIAMIVGAAFGVWSLRPSPSYSSEDLAAGSPFDVTFRVENTDPWFTLSNLRIGCVLAHVRASGVPPTLIEATDVRFPADGASGLEPGESATFTCPFRALTGHPVNDDPAIVQRSEIFFRSEYDLPVIGSLRITEDSGRFFLDTRLLPPRWTGKPKG